MTDPVLTAVISAGVAISTTAITLVVSHRINRVNADRSETNALVAKRADLARDQLPDSRRLFESYIKAIGEVSRCLHLESTEGGIAFFAARNVAEDLLTAAKLRLLDPLILDLMDAALRQAILVAGIVDGPVDLDSIREAHQSYYQIRREMTEAMLAELADLELTAAAEPEEPG